MIPFVYVFVFYSTISYTAIIPGGGRLRAKRLRLNNEHIENLKNNSTLDIFTSENINDNLINNILMCSMFETYFEYPIYTPEFVHEFENKWRSEIYTKENFPKTYHDNILKPINVSCNILYKFRNNVCKKIESTSEINMLFWAFIVPITIISYLSL